MPNKLLYTFGRTFIRMYAFLLLRLDIQAYDDLPPGPKLFVANHPSATDPFIIHLVSPQPMSVLITASAFAVPVFGFFLRKINQIPVVIGEGSKAMEEAHRLLQAGGSVAIFPEGDISPQEGGFNSPRTGAARLALSTGVPVVPVGIHLPRERSFCIKSGISGKQTVGWWYLHGPYSITIGTPMKFKGSVDDSDHVHGVTYRIMEHIRLLAQESERRMRSRRRSASSA